MFPLWVYWSNVSHVGQFRGKALYVSLRIKGTEVPIWLVTAELTFSIIFEGVFVRVFNCKVTRFSLPSHSRFLVWGQGVTRHSPCLNSRDYTPLPYGQITYVNDLGFFYPNHVGGFSVLPPYLFIQSFVYLYTYSWMFILFFGLYHFKFYNNFNK